MIFFEDLGIVQRYLLRRNARDVLQLAQHSRVIVSQNVQLDQNIVHGREVKVRGDGLGGHIVGRVLNGCELIDFILLRQDDHARGMLSRCALDACDSSRQTLLLRIAQAQPSLLGVLENITVCGLVRNRADGSRAVAVFRTEELLDVVVCNGLIFT
jgi:hypothetical protein